MEDNNLNLDIDYPPIVDTAALFKAASLFNHSCVPNVTVGRPALSATDVHFFATEKIAKGDELTVSYYDHENPSLRRQYLFNNYFFWCTCPLCRKEVGK